MTFHNIVEFVQQHHPKVRDNEIRILLNRASDDFCRRTEIFKPIYHQLTAAGQRYYDIAETTLSTGTDANSIIKVLEVWIDDVKIPRLLTPPIIDDDEYGVDDEDLGDGETEQANLGTPSSSSNERYWYIGGPSNESLGIVEKATNAVTRDGKTSNFQSMSEKKELRIFTIALAKHLEADDTHTVDSSVLPGLLLDIPSQFHDALLARIIASLYEDNRNLNIDLSNRFYARYLESVNEAKKFGRSGKTQGGYIIPGHF